MSEINLDTYSISCTDMRICITRKSNVSEYDIDWDDFAEIVEATEQYWRPYAKKKCENCVAYNNYYCDSQQIMHTVPDGFCHNFTPKESEA
ncbi:MAG: hypothetical protein MJ060_04330 [Clostridia bacterium]|nr:hypothetical protein [Clostridia bacterium]